MTDVRKLYILLCGYEIIRKSGCIRDEQPNILLAFHLLLPDGDRPRLRDASMPASTAKTFPMLMASSFAT